MRSILKQNWYKKIATKLKYTEPQPGFEPGSFALPGKCATPKPVAQAHKYIAASPI